MEMLALPEKLQSFNYSANEDAPNFFSEFIKKPLRLGWLCSAAKIQTIQPQAGGSARTPLR
jgi:hypothetical protein